MFHPLKVEVRALIPQPHPKSLYLASMLLVALEP